MNIHVVVEGISEKKVYPLWIPYVNPTLIYVDDIFTIKKNNFSVITGGGYPHYKTVIYNAIEDVNQVGNIDRLIISIDSEEMSRKDKFNEISNYINTDCNQCNAEIKIIIQHFCFETWALGNLRIAPRQPQDATLICYKKTFDVLIEDPELLPCYPPKELNRSQFAYSYLKLLIKDKYKRLIYSKTHPKPLMNNQYFQQIKNRMGNTGHIESFKDFLISFI